MMVVEACLVVLRGHSLTRLHISQSGRGSGVRPLSASLPLCLSASFSAPARRRLHVNVDASTYPSSLYPLSTPHQHFSPSIKHSI